MKQLVPITVLLFSCNLLFAQYENFDLSKYKLPDIKRHQLDFYFYSNGASSSDISFLESGDKRKSYYNNFDGYGRLNYNYFRNSNRYQTELTISTLGELNREKSTGDYSDDYSFIGKGELILEYDVKHFSKYNNWFITAVPYITIRNSKNKGNIDDENYTNFSTSSSLSLGGGKGRIEQVQDFRHAILILNELEKRGVIERNPSEKEIIELAIVISEIKNKRFFDSRKRKEAEIIAIDSFLSDKGIISDKSISYYTGLGDMWSFGALQIRENGNQIQLTATPHYSFYNSKSPEDNIGEYVSLNYNLSFASYKPLSVKWQTNYSIAISHSNMKRLQSYFEELPERNYNSMINGYASIGYYPNTRTNFYLTYISNLGNYSHEDLFDKENYSISSRIYTGAYYYISERLRIGYYIGFNKVQYGIFNKDVPNYKKQ